jgi:speckle-type POZ protein
LLEFPKEDRPRSIAVCFNGSLANMSRHGERWDKRWNCLNVEHLSSFLRHNTTFQIMLNLPCPGEENILKHLSTLLENQHMADVQFVVKGHEIGAHMLILSCNPVMAAMLDPDKFQEGQTKRVLIDDIEPETFRLLLGYLYTGKFPDVNDALKIEQLLSAAEMYQIEGLKEHCEEYLKPRVTLENVIRLLVVAHLYLAPKLMETCLSYLSDFSKQIWPRPEWKELVKIYPDLFFVASQRMSKQ